jgi:hypothetical protein
VIAATIATSDVRTSAVLRAVSDTGAIAGLETIRLASRDGARPDSPPTSVRLSNPGEPGARRASMR